MKAAELRKKFIKFFEKRGHRHIPSAPLVPKEDPTTLFVSAGMQPLVPYLLGQSHPEGKRLVNWQKCLRTDDIDEVGDTFHHTFFEMLGNWSLGDYFKEESIPWSLEFLTDELGLKKDKISVSVFAGDEEAPKDEESARIWKKLGIPEERIYYYGKEDNWWAAGPAGPAGPDTEIFYDVTGETHGPGCEPRDNCGRYFEIWNNVFMVYNRKEDGTLEELPNKNVDTGMGLERTVAVLQGKDDDYETELFTSIVQSIEESLLPKFRYGKEERLNRAFRIIADHMKAVVFAIPEGVEPSNKDRGYVVRRLIRRAATQKFLWGNKDASLSILVKPVVSIYGDVYPEIKNPETVEKVIKSEEEKFSRTLDIVMKEWRKWVEKSGAGPGPLGTTRWGETGEMPPLPAEVMFRLYEAHGLPLEIMEEITGGRVDKSGFEKLVEKHREISRAGAKRKFRGGLADTSENTVKLHTATHLLHEALRRTLGKHVQQKGSNITPERLRFDFSHPEKLTKEELRRVEDLVNTQIEKGLPVSWKTTTLEEALAEGALAFFGEKYGERVKVYTIGDPEGEWFSKEVCGGPHVDNTKEIGHVTITKEESAGSGVRRIYAELR